MKVVIAAQPFHAGLHLMPSVDKRMESEDLLTPGPHVLASTLVI
jgi:hypothetical protein